MTEKRRLFHRKPEFMECGPCSAKPGSPKLCESCLHNRKAVDDAWETGYRKGWEDNAIRIATAVEEISRLKTDQTT